jgi:hypothetical protein
MECINSSFSKFKIQLNLQVTIMKTQARRLLLIVLLLITSSFASNVSAQPLGIGGPPVLCNGFTFADAQKDCFEYIMATFDPGFDLSWYCTYGNPETNVFVAPGLGPTLGNLTGKYAIPCTHGCTASMTTLDVPIPAPRPAGFPDIFNPNGTLPTAQLGVFLCPCYNFYALLQWNMVCKNRYEGSWTPG